VVLTKYVGGAALIIGMLALAQKLANYQSERFAWYLAVIAAILALALIALIARDLWVWWQGRSVLDLIHAVEFRYLPAPPLENGWSCGYGTGTPIFGSDSNIPGSLTMQVQGGYYALDFQVPQYAKLCDRIDFRAKFIKDAFFFAEVVVVSKDGSNPDTWWLAHVMGNRAHHIEPNYKEWKFYVSPRKGTSVCLWQMRLGRRWVPMGGFSAN
jgi:hypothetical protein